VAQVGRQQEVYRRQLHRRQGASEAEQWIVSQNFSPRCGMSVNTDEIIEKAFEQAFIKAMDQAIQTKVEALFKKAFENGSDLAKKLEAKLEEGFDRFSRKEFAGRGRSPTSRNTDLVALGIINHRNHQPQLLE
jgi:hypothetical protein